MTGPDPTGARRVWAAVDPSAAGEVTTRQPPEQCPANDV
jgi:hypothetical protein